jgi:nicotinic acid mononucleotide adenylyltransferase
MPYMELSSTVIRQRAKMGLSLDFYVPKAVADYIRDNKLYK